MALESRAEAGRYEITEPIGKSRMSRVGRACDRKLGREVAVQVLPSEFSQDGV